MGGTVSRVGLGILTGGASEIARLPGGDVINPLGAAANKAAGAGEPEQPGPGPEPKAAPERQAARDPISLIMRFLGRRGGRGASGAGRGVFDSQVGTAQKSLIGG